MTMLTDNEKAEAVRDYQRQTTGTQYLHWHWLGCLIYTDGMAFMAETCGAFWLLDLVASHQPPIKRNHRGLMDFQVWRVSRTTEPNTPEGVDVEAWSDTPGADWSVRLAFQHVEFSDFPAELMPFEFYVEFGVALLKEER